jgi:pyruvate formate lyase activating enzyme
MTKDILTNQKINNTSNKRNVISITRMTIHNGPGIRTLILFKGCPLCCLWCSTPESQKMEPELGVFPDKCIHCDQCLPACPINAITLTDKTLSVNRRLCNHCGKCVQVCAAEALKMLGHPMLVEELVAEIKKDLVFFRKSQGGVTISGGEPLLDREYNLELLPRLKEEGITVGVDTCGYIPWGHIEPLLPYIDFFLWDIKHIDSGKHQQLTGVPNELILCNARLVATRNIPIYIRIPVIPGFNDSEENLSGTCEFVRGLSSVVEVGLLPLHHFGKARYASLDRVYPIESLALIPEDILQNLKRLVESYGLKCSIIN